MHIRRATSHIPCPGAADLPAVGSQMIAVMDSVIVRDAQHGHRIALMVQHCMRAVVSGGYGGAEPTPRPSPLYKGIVWEKVWYG